MQPQNSNDQHQPYSPPKVLAQPTPQHEQASHSAFAAQPDTPASTASTLEPAHSSPFSEAYTQTSPVITEQPTYAMQTDHTPATDTPKTNVSDLTLYLVVLFSGLFVIAGASYLVWTILTHFLTEPEAYSFFDLSTFNIYVLIDLVLFGTLNILASLRLHKRVKDQGTVGSSLSTVGAIWRALLVVWGVSAVVGILYSPLSASVAGDEVTMSKIAIDVVSALIALVLITVFYWRDVLLHKVRTALIPTVMLAALLVLISSVGAFTTLNPKKATPETPAQVDYSSSFEGFNSDAPESDFQFDSSNTEVDSSVPQ